MLVEGRSMMSSVIAIRAASESVLSAGTRSYVSNALVQKSDARGAVEEGREAVRFAPNDSEAHRTLGRALAFAADTNGAVAELRAASELNRHARICMMNLGLCCAAIQF